MTIQHRYITYISIYFVSILLISNIASTKIISLGKIVLDGGTLLFPLSYIFNDILTEIYGYARSREIIWLGFVSTITMSLLLFVVGILPPSQDWTGQDSYMRILGQTPRIVCASLVAYLIGEFTNSYVLAKMKILTRGRWLWTRTIGSTLVGELLDSIFFVCIAFYGSLPNYLLINLIEFNYFFKTAMEIIFTPVTYQIINFLKKQESIDHYDRYTNFNPFAFATSRSHSQKNKLH